MKDQQPPWVHVIWAELFEFNSFGIEFSHKGQGREPSLLRWVVGPLERLSSRYYTL